jgi:hydroxymethylbilane synthase
LPKSFRIGTRGSLLARTQSTQIKEALEQLTGHAFELEIIQTQGDQDTSKPLWQLEGKDFFTKELDQALLERKIDLVVHSYKDLGSERPKDIQLAAITERKFGHDILLTSTATVNLLKDKKIREFNLGTSSPRRIHNCKKHLASYLPYGEDLTIKTKMLRGNINTRIEKLRNGEYHGIVLALAGLERLALTPASKETLKELLTGLDFMLLPHSSFPSAASQGALAIECHRENSEVCQMLEKLRHEKTEDEIFRERQAFNDYGGGCHLAVGIQVDFRNGHYLHIHKGTLENEEINNRHIEGIALPKPEGSLFIGLPESRRAQLKGFSPQVIMDEVIEKVPLSGINLAPGPLYITSINVLNAIEGKEIKHSLWVPGNKTWKRMAGEGHWIQGSSDGLGDNELKNFIQSEALQLFPHTIKGNLQVLTHTEGTSPLGKIISCYNRKSKSIEEKHIEELKKVGLFYWTSFYQYETFCQLFPFVEKAKHACGLGKTWDQFKKKEIAVTPVAALEDLKPWDLL